MQTRIMAPAAAEKQDVLFPDLWLHCQYGEGPLRFTHAMCQLSTGMKQLYNARYRQWTGDVEYNAARYGQWTGDVDYEGRMVVASEE